MRRDSPKKTMEEDRRDSAALKKQLNLRAQDLANRQNELNSTFLAQTQQLNRIQETGVAMTTSLDSAKKIHKSSTWTGAVQDALGAAAELEWPHKGKQLSTSTDTTAKTLGRHSISEAAASRMTELVDNQRSRPSWVSNAHEEAGDTDLNEASLTIAALKGTALLGHREIKAQNKALEKATQQVDNTSADLKTLHRNIRKG